MDEEQLGAVTPLTDPQIEGIDLEASHWGPARRSYYKKRLVRQNSPPPDTAQISAAARLKTVPTRAVAARHSPLPVLSPAERACLSTESPVVQCSLIMDNDRAISLNVNQPLLSQHRNRLSDCHAMKSR